MANPLTYALIAGALKRIYPAQTLEDHAALESPFYGIIKKNTGGTGAGIACPIWYNNGANMSGDFATALANSKPASVAQFLFGGVTTHYPVLVNGDAIAAAAGGSEQSFIDALKLSTQSAIDALTNRLGQMPWCDGTGWLATFSAISTGVITLPDDTDVLKIPVGTVLQASNSKGGSAVAALGYVIGADPAAHTITISDTDGGAAATPTGWSTTYPYLHQYGSRGAAGTYEFIGVPGFLPETAPTSTLFGGVDRTAHYMLSGYRFPATGLTRREALIKCAAKMDTLGARPSHVFVNPLDWALLELEIDSKQTVRVSAHEDHEEVGYDAIMVTTPKGKVPVLADRGVPANTAYMIEAKDWELVSRGSVGPDPWSPNGGMHMNYNTDDLVIRYSFRRAALLCHAPGKNAVLSNFGA